MVALHWRPWRGALVWFVAGAVLGLAHGIVRLVRAPRPLRSPARTLVITTFIGLMAIGLPLWLAAHLI